MRATLTESGARRIGRPDLAGARVEVDGVRQEASGDRVATSISRNGKVLAGKVQLCDEGSWTSDCGLVEVKPKSVSAGQTKVMLMGVFLSAASVVGLATGGVHLSPFEWLMLGLAALRCGRMIAFELIFEPIRRPFAVVQPHQYAGDTTEPRYEKGWKHSIGEAMTCPMCAGTWSAAALLYGTMLVPGPAWVLVTILSAVSLLEVGDSLIEALCWTAARNRKESR